MIRGLKKTFSVILLFIFLYNISGYYLAFMVRQSEVKEAAQHIFKERNTDDLLLIKISPEEEINMIWYGNDEFRLNGKMYDVAFSKHEGNALYLYCYNDSKEDHLFASLNLHIKNTIDTAASQKNSKNTLKVPLPDYFKDFNKNEFSCFVYTLINKTHCNFSLLNFSPDKPSPPPRLA